MNLNTIRDDVPYNIPDSFCNEALNIRNQLLRFRLENKGKIILKPELEDRSIEPRLNQIAIPLMSIIKNQEIVAEIKNQFKGYNEQIKTDRTLSYNYQILDTVCELLDSGFIRPTVKDVTIKFNDGLHYTELLTAKKMGFLINKALGLRTERTRDGFIISESNRKKIELLRKKYGIKHREHVNDVNIEIEEKDLEIT